MSTDILGTGGGSMPVIQEMPEHAFCLV